MDAHTTSSRQVDGGRAEGQATSHRQPPCLPDLLAPEQPAPGPFNRDLLDCHAAFSRLPLPPRVAGNLVHRPSNSAVGGALEPLPTPPPPRPSPLAPHPPLSSATPPPSGFSAAAALGKVRPAPASLQPTRGHRAPPVPVSCRLAAASAAARGLNATSFLTEGLRCAVLSSIPRRRPGPLLPALFGSMLSMPCRPCCPCCLGAPRLSHPPPKRYHSVRCSFPFSSLH